MPSLRVPSVRVMGLDDFSDADLAVIAATEAPAEAKAFDAERDNRRYGASPPPHGSPSASRYIRASE
jgi:hypothetical protein